MYYNLRKCILARTSVKELVSEELQAGLLFNSVVDPTGINLH